MITAAFAPGFLAMLAVGGAAALTAQSGAVARATVTATAPILARGYSPQTVRRVYGVSPLLRKRHRRSW
jgi:hypothetical protein